MNWKKYLLIAAATFLILFSGIVTVLLFQSKVEADKEQSNAVNSQGTATTESNQGNVNISVTNNIQNIVSGESKATIENKVKNDID